MAALLLTVAACGSGGVGGGGAPTIEIPTRSANPDDLEGFSSRGVSSVVITGGAFGADAAALSDMSLEFGSANDVVVTVADLGPITLVWDELVGAYVDSTGNFRLFAYVDPSLPTMVFYRASINAIDLGETIIVNQFTGDLTVGLDFAETGTVSYSGIVDVTDEFLSRAGGEITIVADFSDDTVTGNMSIDAGTTLGAADFALTGGAINRGATFMNFDAGLTSADVTVVEGEIHGEFIGADAGFVGGVIALDSDAGSVAGIFVAE